MSFYDDFYDRIISECKENRNISTVEISFYGKGAEEVINLIQKLSDALKINKYVSSLGLCFIQNAKHESIQKISEVLKVNNTLKRLSLTHIKKLEEPQVSLLSQALKENKSITQLIISNNEIDAEAIKPLAEVLKVNNRLEILDLSHNELGEEGAKKIAEALESNKTLKKLNITCNGIGTNGVEYFFKALLSFNKTITNINVGRTAFKAKARLDLLLCRNRLLKEETSEEKFPECVSEFKGNTNNTNMNPASADSVIEIANNLIKDMQSTVQTELDKKAECLKREQKKNRKLQAKITEIETKYGQLEVYCQELLETISRLNNEKIILQEENNKLREEIRKFEISETPSLQELEKLYGTFVEILMKIIVLKHKKLIEEEEKRLNQDLRENKNYHKNDLCIACVTNPKDHAFVKCGHLCVCESCAVRLEACPVCRKKSNTIKIFQ